MMNAMAAPREYMDVGLHRSASSWNAKRVSSAIAPLKPSWTTYPIPYLSHPPRRSTVQGLFTPPLQLGFAVSFAGT
jgi:hypothetical protein